jgi:hypothetical protein
VGSLPLDISLYNSAVPASLLLLTAGPAIMVLEALVEGGDMTMFADYIWDRLPLSEAEWALMPTPCEDLGVALPAALAHSSTQAAALVKHLPATDAEALRTAALCLARAQRRHGVCLPTPIVWRVLSHFDPGVVFS